MTQLSKVKAIFGHLGWLYLILNCEVSYAQVDSIFWFSAPEISEHTSNFDKPIVLRITTLNQPANVVITQPANTAFAAMKISIPASSTKTVDLTPFIDGIETKPPNSILKTGVLIRSDNLVTTYYEVASQQCNCNPEIFSLKGKNALGTLFYVPTQMTYDNSNRYTPQASSSFDIVSTEDNNLVTINPKKSIVGRIENVPFSITLNRGETYSAQAVSVLGVDHLAGSKVTSRFPIAVTVKDDLLEGLGPCRDVAGDQIVSVNQVGREYIVVKGFLDGNREIATIVATESNTEIFVGNSLNSLAILNAGEYFEVNLNQNATYIRGSKPVYLWHTSGFKCELAGALLPPINCTGTFSTSVVRSTADQLGLILFTTKDGINSFSNNRGLIINSSVFDVVDGTSDNWYAARLELTNSNISVGQVLNISNSTHLFHLGFINGVAGAGTRYGYFSDYNKVIGNLIDIKECDRSEVVLSHRKGNINQWSTGSTLDSIVVENSGMYWVDYEVNECPVTDSFNINFIRNENVVYSDTVLCENQILEIMLTEGETLLDSNLVELSGQSISKEGLYYVYLEECSRLDSFYVDKSKIDLELGKDTTYCDSITLEIDIAGFESYLWSNGSRNSDLSIRSEGIYWLQVEDEFGCQSVDSIQIAKGIKPSLNLGNDSILCTSSSGLLDPGYFSKYEWSTGSNERFLTMTSFGEIWVKVTNSDGCSAYDTIILTKSSSKGYENLLIPNSFSPNNDNLNESFPFYESQIEVEAFELKIYNRWGQKVFTSTSPLDNWNGKYMDKPASQDVYIYIIRWKDCSNNAKFLSNSFHLIR
jgi:gliding motility-associated-like protein